MKRFLAICVPMVLMLLAASAVEASEIQSLEFARQYISISSTDRTLIKPGTNFPAESPVVLDVSVLTATAGPIQVQVKIKDSSGKVATFSPYLMPTTRSGAVIHFPFSLGVFRPGTFQVTASVADGSQTTDTKSSTFKIVQGTPRQDFSSIKIGEGIRSGLYDPSAKELAKTSNLSSTDFLRALVKLQNLAGGNSFQVKVKVAGSLISKEFLSSVVTLNYAFKKETYISVYIGSSVLPAGKYSFQTFISWDNGKTFSKLGNAIQKTIGL